LITLRIAQEEILVLEKCTREIGNALIAEKQSPSFLLNLLETDLFTAGNVTPNEDLEGSKRSTQIIKPR
jgi:hypothetical protein